MVDQPSSSCCFLPEEQEDSDEDSDEESDWDDDEDDSGSESGGPLDDSVCPQSQSLPFTLQYSQLYTTLYSLI